MREYYEQLYSNKVNNLDKMSKFRHSVKTVI